MDWDQSPKGAWSMRSSPKEAWFTQPFPNGRGLGDPFPGWAWPRLFFPQKSVVYAIALSVPQQMALVKLLEVGICNLNLCNFDRLTTVSNFQIIIWKRIHWNIFPENNRTKLIWSGKIFMFAPNCLSVAGSRRLLLFTVWISPTNKYFSIKFCNTFIYFYACKILLFAPTTTSFIGWRRKKHESSQKIMKIVIKFSLYVYLSSNYWKRNERVIRLIRKSPHGSQPLTEWCCKMKYNEFHSYFHKLFTSMFVTFIKIRFEFLFVRYKLDNIR